jgi:hypothetical protein
MLHKLSDLSQGNMLYLGNGEMTNGELLENLLVQGNTILDNAVALTSIYAYLFTCPDLIPVCFCVFGVSQMHVSFVCRNMSDIPAQYSKEWFEMRSEDPSQLVDGAGMDISPQSPWKTPVKIEPGVSAAAGAGKDDDVADALQNLSLSDIKKLQDKNKELEEKVAMLSAPVSDGKYGNKDRHTTVLIDTKNIIDGVYELAGDKCALWWCNFHIEKLLEGDKPACYDSYKVHAKKTLKKTGAAAGEEA